MSRGPAHPPGFGVEVWRGAVKAWECDEMGHLNVRFHVARAREGVVGLAAALGMPDAFRPSATASLRLLERRIRFLREARAASPLYMRAGILSAGEDEIEVLSVLFHADDHAPASAFVSRYAHVAPKDGRRFPWPRRVRDRLPALACEIPDYARARGAPDGPPAGLAGEAAADRLGLVRLASGAVFPQDCDAFGRALEEQFISRVSDGIVAMVGPVRTRIAEAADPRPARVGGVALEYRIVHLDWPQPGDRFEIRSGFAGFETNTFRIVNWMINPDTGEAYVTSAAVAAAFDLDARRIIPINASVRGELEGLIVPGLGL